MEENTISSGQWKKLWGSCTFRVGGKCVSPLALAGGGAYCVGHTAGHRACFLTGVI